MTKLEKPRAIIFDWDDTLVDNFETAFKALNTALTHMGAQGWTADEARRRSGPSARDLFTSLFGADRWKEADKVYYDTFCALVEQNVKLHENAENFLKLLHDNGIFMAVVSNKRNPLLGREVKHLGFDKYFPKVVGAGEASADKPSPAPLLMALEGTGIEPGPHVWYLGDSHTDMMCAISAGCTAVLLETKPPPADLLIKNPPAARFRTHGELMEYVSEYFA
jgi:phosphoglycolate phosphatase